MEHQHGKYVRVICDLNVGDKVTTDISYSTKGKTLIITDIKWMQNSETGFIVKLDLYSGYIDSNWITKL